MGIPAIESKVHAANLPLERLANSTQVEDREKIAEVSRQFEAVLLRQILAQAQKPLFNTTLAGGGGSTRAIYQDMVTQQLADRISHGGTFGFGKVLEKELSAQYIKKEKVAPKPLDISSASQAHPRNEVVRPSVQVPSTVPVQKRYITVTPQPGKRI